MSRLQDITTFTDSELDDKDYLWVNEYKSATATITIASPAVITSTAHGLEVGNKVIFTSSGSLPTGLAVSTDYYIISGGFGVNSFQLSATYGGVAIDTSGSQSGVHTYTSYVSKKISGDKIKTVLVPDTTTSEVAFDKLTPTTSGVVFDPNTPSQANTLYYSTVDGSTWVYKSGVYVSKVIPSSTPFAIDGFTTDVGGNKTSPIARTGSIAVKDSLTGSTNASWLYSYGLSILTNTYAQITQTTISNTLYALTRFTRRRGTLTSSTNAQNGDNLGVITFNGGSLDSANILVQATETHGGTNGTSIYIQATKTGQSGVSTAISVGGDGVVDLPQGFKNSTETASRIASFDSNKKVVSLDTATYPSLTELSYVKDVTSSIQTQIDTKQPLTPRVQTVASNATVTATSTNDLVDITAQAEALDIANPTGTYGDGQTFLIRINDDGSARAITFGAKFIPFGTALPTTTTVGKTTLIGCTYRADNDTFETLNSVML